MVQCRIFGHYIGTVPPQMVEPYRMLESALTATGYVPESVWSYNCRTIAGSTKKSLHAYGIAVDIDPHENPQGGSSDPWACKLTPEQVKAVTDLRSNGKQLWTWGGLWGSHDRMHFQINVGPDDTPTSGTTPPTSERVFTVEVIKGIQQALKDAKFDPGPVDGVWGPHTAGAFSDMCKAAKSGGLGSGPVPVAGTLSFG